MAAHIIYSATCRANLSAQSLSLSVVSADTVITGSLEGCGAPGLEKAPTDAGISQGALCLWSLAQSVSPIDSPRMTLMPQRREFIYFMTLPHNVRVQFLFLFLFLCAA